MRAEFADRARGSLDRLDARTWLEGVGNGSDSENELIHLIAEDDPGMVPAGFEHLAVEV
ncbi:hypothetical protein [Streptomyces sp. NPDC050264]|uniref:hypothetical protein n=1 Tax=Streptomyces sp. NPDC050264 TaxID=3155038 RepID=UPI00343A6682